MDQSGGDGTKERHFERFPDGLVAPFGGLLRHLFGTFFVSGLQDSKKGGLGGASKLDPFFCRLWSLPRGPQEGSRPHGSSIFTFAAGPKKGSKMGAKMEPPGLPNQNYTHFGPPFGINRGPKSWIEK